MKNNSGNKLKYYLELSKLKIMIPVSLTGFTGYFIFDPHISFKIILVSFGILLLAISASVLNQIQEVELDSKMNRTHDRPLPAEKIKLQHAILFFFCNLIAGIHFIYSAGNLKAALIGLITIVMVQWDIYLFKENNCLCSGSRCCHRCIASAYRMGGSRWRSMG